ncbi:MAG: hypothetical protein ABH952_12125 [Candidatus Omnitrophota bacterium]
MGWKQRAKDWLTKDLISKIICLVLAVLIWVYISSELARTRKDIYVQRVLHDLEVSVLGRPLQFSNVIFGVKIEPKFITLAIRGPESKINGLTKDDLNVFVNIENIELDREYPLPVQMILPPQVETIGPKPICRVTLSTKNEKK